MSAKVLRLNKAGIPVSWLTREETATLLVKDLVVWSLGSTVFEMRGGINHSGDQSVLQLPSIVACDGKVHENKFDPPLENGFLFRRDKKPVSIVAVSLSLKISLEIMCSLFLAVAQMFGPTS